MAVSIAVDKSGNVCVTGPTGFGGVEDYLSIKYDADGDTVWVRTYAGTLGQNDLPAYVGADSLGNFYVIGYSAETGTSFDCTIIKYAPNGDTVWVRRFGPSGIQAAYAGFVDPAGNAYVGGEAPGTGVDDFLTIKYNNSGDTLWARTYNGPGNGSDNVTDITADTAGNVYATGESQGAGTLTDYATIKYSPAGDTLWVRRYNGLGNNHDFARAVVVDKSGNVYVAGSSHNGVAPSYDYTTIKYAPNGNTLWVRHYNGTGNGPDEVAGLALDDLGNVYVTGYTEPTNGLPDMTTLKYAPDGTLAWARDYNGPSDDDDAARAIALDDSGNVYVTGYSFDILTDYDFVSIKYAPNGDTLWVRRYNGPENFGDQGNAIGLDNNGNVFVAGTIDGSATGLDFGTIKYSDASLCTAKPGDANGDGIILLSDIVNLINFLFKSQPAPSPLCRGDANASGSILLSDVIYLVNFIFKSGPAPVKNGVCCL